MSEWIRADEVRAGDEIVGPSDDPARRDCGVVEDPNQTCKWPSENQRLIGFVGGSGIAVEPHRRLLVNRAPLERVDTTGIHKYGMSMGRGSVPQSQEANASAGAVPLLGDPE